MASIKLLHPKFLHISLFLLLLNTLMFAVFFKYANPSLSIFPDNKPPYEWTVSEWHDENSSLSLDDKVHFISADLKLSGKSDRPHAGIALNFDKSPDKYVSFAEFNRVKLKLKCSAKSTLYLGLSSHDAKVTQYYNPLTYRTAGAFISCDTDWRDVTLNLSSLEVQVWWLAMFKYKATENSYDLTKIMRVYLESSYETPLDTELKVKVAEIRFDGHNDTSLYVFAGISLLVWISFFTWMARFYVKEKSSEKRSVQVLEYEKLNFDPIRDRDKKAILEYVSKNYASPDIDAESVCKAVGVSRTKVNEVLKSEFGDTFTNYVNKLRLIEASRLLVEKSDAHITEIAYLVGFKNISYFNKLFKEYYGSTPKTFKNKKDS